MTLPTTIKMLASDLDLRWLNQTMPEALSGVEQTFTGPDALWIGQLRVYLKIGTPQRDWQAFIDAREGTLNTFDFYPTRWIWCGLPVADAPVTPPTTWDSTTVTWDSTTATWDEGSGATDAPITFNANRGSKALTVTHSGVAGKWRPGILFNIGAHMYRVGQITGISGDDVSMEIAPRLREAVDAGTLLTEAKIAARLATPSSGRIRKTNVPQEATLEIAEDPA